MANLEFGLSRSDSLLVSFAILQVNYDDRGSAYIDNFVPFVAQCIKDSDHKEIATAELQTLLNDRFGLLIPQHALAAVIKRGARRGLYKRANHAIVRDSAALESVDIEQSRQLALRSYHDLLQRFIAFAGERFGRALTVENADSILLQYIVDRSLPIVRMTLLGEDFRDELMTSKGLDVVVAEFIIHLAEADVVGFEHLNMIVRGCVLATSVYLPDPNEHAKRVTDLDVYFDTPLLVNLLGLHGDARRDATHELVVLLAGLGARLRCFAHTFAETENLILSCAEEVSSLKLEDSQHRNEIVSFALSKGIGRTDLELCAGLLEDKFDELGISIRNAPDYSRNVPIDEVKLEACLQSRVGYLNPGARRKDLESLTAIWRLRGGCAMRHLESARAIFVTSNDRVVAASREFFGERPNGFVVPVCALEGQLATVAWLKRPTAAPNLPGKQIIADCYAALEPGDALWRRYVEIIDQLRATGQVTEEQFATLRFTVEAKRALVAEVEGNVSELVVGTIPEVLRRANALRSAEQTRAIADANARVTEAEASAELEARLREAETLQLRSESTARNAERQRKIGEVSHHLAHRFCKGLYAIVVVVVISYLYFGPAIRSSAHSVGSWAVVSVSVLFFGAIGLILNHVVRGTSIGRFISDCERYLEVRIDRWLTKRFEP